MCGERQGGAAEPRVGDAQGRARRSASDRDSKPQRVGSRLQTAAPARAPGGQLQEHNDYFLAHDNKLNSTSGLDKQTDSKLNAAPRAYLPGASRDAGSKNYRTFQSVINIICAHAARPREAILRAPESRPGSQ